MPKLQVVVGSTRPTRLADLVVPRVVSKPPGPMVVTRSSSSTCVTGRCRSLPSTSGQSVHHQFGHRAR
jgi:hypothetical protein